MVVLVVSARRLALASGRSTTSLKPTTQVMCERAVGSRGCTCKRWHCWVQCKCGLNMLLLRACQRAYRTRLGVVWAVVGASVM